MSDTVLASAAADGDPPAGPDSNRVATVLLVDGDPLALQRLRDATRRWHAVWDIHVAAAGEEALARFDHLPVDVLVTDLDMPGMTAVELLSTVRARSPHTARIIMSGRADRASALREIDAAHRYLTKPVDVELLAGLIEHVRGATDNELREPVRSLVNQVERLPSPPALFQRLTTMLTSTDWTIDEIAAEIADDVALTAEILKLVNSAFYGIYGEVTSANRAISLIGVDMVRYVVLGNKLFQSRDEFESWLDLGRLDRRSKAVAFGARALALRDGASPETAAAAYLTGIVSEIGLLVLGRVPDISPSIAQPLNTGTYIGAERAIFGGDRFEAGCQLLRLWGFSETVIAAIGHLSRPRGIPSGVAWYLMAARRLVSEEGRDPHDLAGPTGANPDIDAALDRLGRELAGTSATP